MPLSKHEDIIAGRTKPQAREGARRNQASLSISVQPLAAILHDPDLQHGVYTRATCFPHNLYTTFAQDKRSLAVNDKEIEMSKRVAVLAGIAILLALSVAPAYAQDGRGNGRQPGRPDRGAGQGGLGFLASLPPASAEPLPEDIVNLMIDGWQDEQQAYAIYESVMAQFGAYAPFVNIQRAEAQHIAAWEFLFARYGITVPDVPAFDIPAFASRAEACAVAAEAEIANFGLYDAMLQAFSAYPDLHQVTLALRNASEFQHLPALERCAAR